MSEPYEYIDRQPYYAECVDQGFSQEKSGKIVFKLYCRVLGKPKSLTDPAGTLEPVNDPNPEKEIRMSFDGNPDYVAWRIRDLQSLGFTGTDLSVLAPSAPNHQSFVGKKLIIAPNIKDEGRTFWNVMPQKKRYINDVSLDQVKAKTDGLASVFQKLTEKKAEKKKTEAVPF